MRIEAEIGDRSVGALKSLEKVESFIVSQLKKNIKDTLVYPNVVTVAENVAA